ncbi:MAG: F0F1 ATP synthase subunit B [Rhizobacter sp.]|nr:F0F1 ATP synthase subunit B [Chlorobiales bacterium]
MTTLGTFTFILLAENGGLDLLTPNPGVIFWTLVTFGLLLILLRLYAWKPIVDALESREKNIKSSIERAEFAKSEAERILAENKLVLEKAGVESDRLIAEGKVLADKLKADARISAGEEVKKIVEAAKLEIARKKDQALLELRAEVADLAIKAAEKIILANLDAEKQKDVIASVIDNIGKSNTGNGSMNKQTVASV